MFFRRFRQKSSTRHVRLRVESCVSTILSLNEHLGDGKIKPEIIQQFERLQESLKFVTDESVDEKDITRIEDATNQLLSEIRTSCEGDGLHPPLYDGRTH